MWTKAQLVSSALGELTLGGEFDITPEEQQDAVRRLDAMLAMWESKGIRLGYSLPASPDDSDAETQAGIPDTSAEAVYLNLAVRLAPMFGKQLSQDTRAAARQAYEPLLIRAAQPPQQDYRPSLPAGAGGKPWQRYPFLPAPNTDPLRNDASGGIEFPE